MNAGGIALLTRTRTIAGVLTCAFLSLSGCGDDTTAGVSVNEVDAEAEDNDSFDATSDDAENDGKVTSKDADYGGETETYPDGTADTELGTDLETLDAENGEDFSTDAVLTEDGGIAGTRLYPPEKHPATLGGDRPATVLVPLDYSNTASYPLVVSLHGYTHSSEFIDDYFNLSAYVSSKQFVLVTPEGTKDQEGQPFWNSPDCCNKFESDVDDLAYITGLIDEAEALIAIDPDRIYIVGMSNGGFMAHYMACEAPEKITAIASLAGMAPKKPADCNPEQATSVLQIHGTLDPLVPYGGTIKFSSVDQTIETWAEINECDLESTSKELPSNYDYLISGPETQKTTWDSCVSGSIITHWEMVESGHTPYLHPDFGGDMLDWLFERGTNGD